MLKYKKRLLKIIFFLIDSIRPILGRRGTCIYHITCTEYAKAILQEKSFFVAIPLIILRVLSCNPLTVLYWKIKAKLKSKKI